MENNKEKKSTGKKVLIIIIAILLIAVVTAGATVGAYIAYKNYNENKSTGTEWGDIYYNYIKDQKENEEEEYTAFKKLEENIEIGFVEIETIEDPVMFVRGKQTFPDNTKADSVYFYSINDNKEVKSVGGFGTTFADVEFLYDVPNKKYDYFLHMNNNTEDTYTSIDTVIRDTKKSNEISKKIKEEKGFYDYDQETKEFDEYKKNETTRVEYVITKEEKVTQDTLSGDVITYDKKDEFIIDPGVEEKKFEFSKDMKNSDIRKNIETEVTEYKTNEELVTDEIKKDVEEKVKSVETKKEQIETAKKEIKEEEDRKAAEEAKKKEEEELKKGLQVGKYRLKYGTYKTDATQMGGNFYGTLELKPNGVFHIKSNCDVHGKGGGLDYLKLDTDGTYKFKRVLNSFTYFDGLEFTTSSGQKFEFEVHEDIDGSIYLSDQWHGYKYQGK